MQNFQTIIMLPWTIRLVYGLIIDSFPIFGYKRKIYMIFCSILGPAMILIILFWGTESYGIHLICLTINAIATAFCDVIADSLTVERTEDQLPPSYQY